ncbi:site-specific integrase [Algoriphagus formosus]|uniref:Integrase n=1 Tax=Algoriphagus formosus TaxID=2007308 RepID=A0A4R5UWK5_9BACT|nr:site-specific integrase [Algoriphagus aquimaris]TDK43485.1 integrase [Algoriphagus aquimaris]
MATLKITLDERRTKKNGTYPVVIRITHQSKSRDIPTGLTANSKNFSKATGSFRTDDEANAQLFSLLECYSTRLKELRKTGIDHLSAQELKNKLLSFQARDEITIKGFWEKEIEHLRSVNRHGSAAIYQNTIQVFEQLTSLKIPFEEFGYKALLDLERKLFAGKRNVNTVGVYMRTFRAICNKAIHQDVSSRDWYPFKNYKIRKAKTTPRVLSLEEMKAFFQLNLLKTDTRYRYWCMGKLMFLLRGINLNDLLLLRPDNIKGDRLIYQRGKTGKSYSIQILPEIQFLLDQFNSNHLLLGQFSKVQMEDPVKFTHVMGQKRKLINKRLKELGKEIGTVEEITTYVFRYSYANIAKQLGFSKDLIAEALGHEYGNSVTGIYLELFDQETLDHMNKRICKKVNEPPSRTP